jgi:glycerol kinase
MIWVVAALGIAFVAGWHLRILWESERILRHLKAIAETRREQREEGDELLARWKKLVDVATQIQAWLGQRQAPEEEDNP